MEVDKIEVFDMLNIVSIWNSGVSFGIGDKLQYSNIIFIIITVSIIVFLLYLFCQCKVKSCRIFLSFIISGALGNLIDRFVFGAVYDFIDFSIYDLHWPAFNVADALIFVGSMLFVVFNYESKTVA